MPLIVAGRIGDVRARQRIEQRRRARRVSVERVVGTARCAARADAD